MIRSELQRALDAVAARISAMRNAYPDQMELLLVLAGELDVIEDRVIAAHDAAYVGSRIDSIIMAAGLI